MEWVTIVLAIMDMIAKCRENKKRPELVSDMVGELRPRQIMWIHNAVARAVDDAYPDVKRMEKRQLIRDGVRQGCEEQKQWTNDDACNMLDEVEAQMYYMGMTPAE